jgi:hypothetical protein
VLVPITSTGKVTLYNNSGTTDVVVHVDRYFSQGATPAGASVYTAIAPNQRIDPRSSSGQGGAGETLGLHGSLTPTHRRRG